MLKSAEDDFQYFGNANKEIREQDTVKQFLSKLDIQYSDDEIHSLEQNNKADIRFRDAMFQVKELTDPNFRRGKFYKDIRNSIKIATRLDQVCLVGDVQDIPPIISIYELVFEKANELANNENYERFKNQLDLLIYVTRTRASLIQATEINIDAFSAFGWRSISCINYKQAVVFSSSSSAPSFITDKLGKVINVNG